MRKLHRVNLKGDLRYNLSLVAGEDWDEQQFLCVQDGRMFVDCVNLLRNPDATMPANCEDGCLYVDNRDARVAVGIETLDELYYISEE